MTRLLNPGSRSAIVDIETGGFSRFDDALIEIAILIVDHEYKILDSFQSYIIPQPGKKISPDAAAINGYRPELWGDFGGRAPNPAELENIVSPLVELSEVRTNIKDWLGGRQGFHGIAYNKGFDKSWCKDLIPEIHDACLPEWRDPCVAFTRWLKKVQGVTQVVKGMAKLGAACERLNYQGVTGETWERHTALDDCYAARFVAECLDNAGFMHDA